jgi:hypothetical protein
MNEITLISLAPIAEIIKKALATEFFKQGHTDSIDLNRVIFEIKYTNGDYFIEFSYPKHWKFQDTGVPASKIPFSGKGRGRAKVSKYIEGLITFAKDKGMINPKNAAFAIAMVHKREGMQTKRSKRFSKTGRRKMFQKDALKIVMPKAEKMTAEIFGELILLSIQNIFTKTLEFEI